VFQESPEGTERKPVFRHGAVDEKKLTMAARRAGGHVKTAIGLFERSLKRSLPDFFLFYPF